MAGEAPPVLDLSRQLVRLREVFEGFGPADREARLRDHAELAARLALAERGALGPVVVVGDQVGAELGRPPAPSHCIVLTVADRALVDHGLVRCYGPELGACVPARRSPLALVVIAALEAGGVPDPLALATIAFLTDRLPGFMARAVPGRLWARASRDALGRGLGTAELGMAVAWAYTRDLPELEAVEVALVTGPEERVRALDGLAGEVLVLTGRHRRLVLAPDGVADCPDLDCERCADRVLCDALRDVTVRYRDSRREAGRPTPAPRG